MTTHYKGREIRVSDCPDPYRAPLTFSLWIDRRLIGTHFLSQATAVETAKLIIADEVEPEGAWE